MITGTITRRGRFISEDRGGTVRFGRAHRAFGGAVDGHYIQVEFDNGDLGHGFADLDLNAKVRVKRAWGRKLSFT